MTPKRKLRATTPQWDVPVCPDPEFCTGLANLLGQTCEELSKARTEPELQKDLLGSPKAKFHAASNPYLSTELRRIAVGLDNHDVCRGLLLNPNLTREDLGRPERWTNKILFLKLFLKRHDLVPAASLLRLAKASASGSFGTWAAMLDNRNLPREAYDLLLEGRNPKLKRNVATHAKAPAYFLEKCLEYPTDEFYEFMWGHEKHPAIYHANLPVNLLLTAVASDELMEVQFLSQAEERSEEVLEWLSQNYPELAVVPIEWARLVLTGGAHG